MQHFYVVVKDVLNSYVLLEVVVNFRE